MREEHDEATGLRTRHCRCGFSETYERPESAEAPSAHHTCCCSAKYYLRAVKDYQSQFLKNGLPNTYF